MMFEVGLGVILAVIFVAAYLIISEFFRRDGHELGSSHPPVTLNPADSTHAISQGKSRPALTSGEEGERQSHGRKRNPGDEKTSKA
jgi:hypothetical protein